MNIFQSVSEVPGMQLDALRLWEYFISLMDPDSLKTYLNGITQGLSNMICIVAPVDRIKVTNVLRNLLIKEDSLEPVQYTDLPTLPNFKELEQIKVYIEEKKLKRSIAAQRKYDMKQILASFSNADSVQVQLGLKRLKELLQTNISCGPLLGELYSKLLYMLQKYAGHRDISYLVSVCLGKLGAIDPGLVDVSIVDDTVFVMNNFGRIDENLNFICDLITNHIYPAYHTVRDEEARQSIEYSIQTLLQQAGFEPVVELKRNSAKLAVYHHWRRLPKWIQEFLTPFLQSHYHVAVAEYRGSYPIFSRAKTFQDWVHHWYRQMTHHARAPAKDYFSACIPMSECKILGVAVHLLPYLVLHMILAGTPDDTRHIFHEIISVLNTNADPDSSSARNHINHYALQVVVAITEYCRKFMTRVGLNDVEKESQVKRVSNFLKLIPNKIMGIAAYHTKAYPQALMQFETYIKKNNIKLQEDSEISDYLRQIYIQIEDPVDLEVLLNVYTAVLSRDQEIIRYERDGQWQMAEALYNIKITQDPSDLSSCTGYMDCFKKSGNYGKPNTDRLDSILYSF
jgi:serine/threonine-protein kinase ATR